MKKLIMALIIFKLLSGSCFACNNLDKTSYINLMSNKVSEMKTYYSSEKEPNELDVLIKGLKSGYFKVQIKRLEAMAYSLNNLINETKDITVDDEVLQLKHNELIKEMGKAAKLIKDNINVKYNVSNSNLINPINFIKGAVKDTAHTNKANEQIEKVNELYKDIQEAN